MSRIFSYTRVSTEDQTTDNQEIEILEKFNVEPHRRVSEVISGSSCAMQRPEFKKLLEKLEAGDTLVVTKLDRLGRDAIDIKQTINHLESLGIKLHCMALEGVDLTSPAGKLHMTILSAFAEFERDLIIERTKSGLQRAKSEGKKLGRKFSLSQAKREIIKKRLEAGESPTLLAKEYDTTRQTILRCK